MTNKTITHLQQKNYTYIFFYFLLQKLISSQNSSCLGQSTKYFLQSIRHPQLMLHNGMKLTHHDINSIQLSIKFQTYPLS